MWKINFVVISLLSILNSDKAEHLKLNIEYTNT